MAPFDTNILSKISPISSTKKQLKFKGAFSNIRDLYFSAVLINTPSLDYYQTLLAINKVLNKIGKTLPIDLQIKREDWEQVFMQLILPSPINNQFNSIYPFSWADAEDRFIIHNINWIDGHIKTEIEKKKKTQEISYMLIEATFKVIALILKCENSIIFKILNNNLCVYIQQLCLKLVLEKEKEVEDIHSSKVGHMANEMALELSKQYDLSNPIKLCGLSISAGTLWFSDDGVQTRYLIDKKQIINNLSEKLDNNYRRLYGKTNIDRFIDLALINKVTSILFILDDNGESVFDLLLIQTLLHKNPSLTIGIIINPRPIKNNFSIDQFSFLLNKDEFQSLDKFYKKGRIKLINTDQPLISLELRLLSNNILDEIYSYDFAYVKGVSFYETVKIRKLSVFYSFIVHGFTSVNLTGIDERTAYFEFCPSCDKPV